MTAPARTPLDAWISARIGLPKGRALNSECLAAWQLARLNETLAFAAAHSPFYQRQGAGRFAPRLTRLEEIATLPFTTSQTLRDEPLQLLCVSQSAVARAVTLRTSGTTGEPKRIFFSQEDLEATIDFFHHGMSTLVLPGQRVLILLPGELPDSVGDLLRRGLARMEVIGIVHGPVADPGLVLQIIKEQHIDSLVGIPAQVLALARHAQGADLGRERIRSVLLSTDYVPRSILAAIQHAWDCDAFQHYGMTEMGYGGGVECAAHEGYHLREADLYFEIIDPATQRPVLSGQEGEVVFTTLGRRAMPLIRYRTGDLAAWIKAPCPCGSALRRMAWVRGRRQEQLAMADGLALSITHLDEVLFALPEVLDYRVVVQHQNSDDHLRITLMANKEDRRLPLRAAGEVAQIPAIRTAAAKGLLTVDPIEVELAPGSAAPPVKRMMKEKCI